MGVVPNLMAAITDNLNRVQRPWNSFFQQFTAQAFAAEIPTSPYTPNTQGNLIFTSGPPSVTLTRGQLSLIITGTRIIPLAVGDTASWSGVQTVHFLRSFSQ